MKETEFWDLMADCHQKMADSYRIRSISEGGTDEELTDDEIRRDINLDVVIKFLRPELIDILEKRYGKRT